MLHIIYLIIILVESMINLGGDRLELSRMYKVHRYGVFTAYLWTQIKHSGECSL